MSEEQKRKTAVVTGSLDTKGIEIEFVADLLRQSGLDVLVIDFGVLGDPPYVPQISSTEVAQAGGGSLEQLRRRREKTEAMRVMRAGLSRIIQDLFATDRLDGILSMGGSGGTVIASAAMRQLPVGLPKVLVSTIGSGDVSPYVGARDIVIIPSVVDVAGINRISRMVYTNAAAALTGMMLAPRPEAAGDRPVISASMFGNTTACVDRARAQLEAHGYEVLVFHATGGGGKTMQNLIADGLIAGVLDITTTELADEVCGGVFSAGVERVRLGATVQTPVVLAPGCVDMCNFWARDQVPERYKHRLLYEWNPNVTLMRTSVEENRHIGAMLAETANLCAGPVAILLPLGGVSMLDCPRGAFWDPEANRACFETLRRTLRPGLSVMEVDCNINDPEFADRAARTLLWMLDTQRGE
ncbi:MAG: Tm-1-like ATP-binding domain-containing protein [Bryobacterales bacterium]|nr:Tm-1-like ATP-binding domain-containing protein [Bryobacterales bacterium]